MVQSRFAIAGPLGLLLIWIALCAPDAVAGEPLITPAENLVVEGVPPIPAQLADALRPYTEFRAASICDWHPVQRHLIVATQLSETPQLHEVKFPGGARTQLTFFKEPVWEADFQPVAGHFLIFARDNGGDENYQKFRFDLGSGPVTTGRATLLTDGSSRNTHGLWNRAGHKYVYASTRRTGADVDLWIVDPADPASDKLLLQLEGGGWTPLDFSFDDRRLLIMNYVSVHESYLWLVDLESGQMSLLTSKTDSEPVAYGGGQFSRDGSRIFVTTDRDSEFHRLASIELADKSHTYFTTDIRWDISQFRLSWDGKSIAFVSNEDGLDVLHLMDAATGKELPKPELPVGIVGGLRWHRNNRDLGFSFLDPRRGSDVYSLDVTKGKIERWTFSETGGIDTEKFSMPELIRWSSFDGTPISGWYFRPPATFAGRRPVVVQIHGGPEGQARPWLSAVNSHLVNELGIALIQPNVRGSAGYGKSFLKLDNGFLRENAHKDIAALFDWIASQETLDADRIMVTGGSYGGYMTLTVAANYADRIRCALDIVGQSNLATFLENTSDYRKDLRRVEYGDERDPKMREFLNRIAPLNNAAKITKPLFIVQGGNDPRVPRSESEQMMHTIRQNGTPVWYLLAKDEGHGFIKKPNEDFLFYATILFVQNYLLDP